MIIKNTMSDSIKNKLNLIFEKNNNILLNELLNTIVDGFILFSEEKQFMIDKNELLEYFKSKENIVIDSMSGCVYVFTKGNNIGQKCGKTFVEIPEEYSDDYPNIYYCNECVRKIRPKKEIKQRGISWKNLIEMIDENKTKRNTRTRTKKNKKKVVSQKIQTQYKIEKFPNGKNTEKMYTVTNKFSDCHYIAKRIDEKDEFNSFMILKKKKYGRYCPVNYQEYETLLNDGFQIDDSMKENIVMEDIKQNKSMEKTFSMSSDSEDNLDMFDSESEVFSSNDE